MLNPESTLRLIRLGLDEDFVDGPDATTVSTIDEGARTTANIVPRTPGVVAGLEVIA